MFHKSTYSNSGNKKNLSNQNLLDSFSHSFENLDGNRYHSICRKIKWGKNSCDVHMHKRRSPGEITSNNFQHLAWKNTQIHNNWTSTSQKSHKSLDLHKKRSERSSHLTGNPKRAQNMKTKKSIGKNGKVDKKGEKTMCSKKV